MHKVTCLMFPDPYDERPPAGPCTCKPHIKRHLVPGVGHLWGVFETRSAAQPFYLVTQLILIKDIIRGLTSK